MYRHFCTAIALSLCICPQLVSKQTADPETVFSDIYQRAGWSCNERGEGTSGIGSTVRNAQPYMGFLEQFIREKKIKTVVELGCGDWEFSQYINWGDVRYIGYDVVKNVVDRDTKLFGNKQIKFRHADILEMKVPKADLVICKDVLAHLPNKDVERLLAKLGHIRYCLFTSCVCTLEGPSDTYNLNQDIALGEFRQLDLAKPPFSVKGKPVFRYATDHSYKEVFLVEH